MKNKKFILYLVVSLIAVAVVVVVYQLAVKGGKVSLPSLQLQQQETIEILAKVVKVNGEDKIALTIKPKKDSFTLSAFSLKATLKHPQLTTDTVIETNQNLIDNAWSFPLLRYADEQDNDQTVAVEISGFRLGNSPYTVDRETVLAYFPLEDAGSSAKVGMTVDREKTTFYASDAITELAY